MSSTLAEVVVPHQNELRRIPARVDLPEDDLATCEAQALMLNGHFIMEHAARNRSGRFFNFNGTAGLRRGASVVPETHSERRI